MIIRTTQYRSYDLDKVRAYNKTEPTDADTYLCLIEKGTMPTNGYGTEPYEQDTWGEYEQSQNGYKMATERLALPKDDSLVIIS